MSDAPSPSEIARRLTPAQRRALLWLPGEFGVERKCWDWQGNPMILVVLSRDEPALCYATENEGWMASRFGLRARAELEKEAGR